MPGFQRFGPQSGIDAAMGSTALILQDVLLVVLLLQLNFHLELLPWIHLPLYFGQHQYVLAMFHVNAGTEIVPNRLFIANSTFRNVAVDLVVPE